MSIINAYGDSTITVWELDDDGQKISIPVQNETKQVIGNKIVLEGLPDEQYRVFIDGFVEIDINDKITEPNQFKVAYRNGTGVVFVHESLDGQWITISRYYSRGMYYIPSSRIWTKINDFGEVTQTLGDVVDNIDSVIETINDLNNSIELGKTTKTALDASTSLGNTTKINLDNSISTATTKKAQLDESISTSNTSKSNLDASIANANTSKSNLDTSIEDATTLKSNLDSSILSGNTLKTNLDESITIGTTLKNNLDTNITIGNQLKMDLPPLISGADTAKTNLETTINNADDKKVELDSSISTANTTKTELDTSIANANTINDILSNPTTGTIKQATDTNTALNSSIDIAGTSKTNLDTSISNSITAKTNLDNSISTANMTKTALDGSIIEGNTLKEELNTIIEGTDFEQVITDVNSLKQDQHNHNNKDILDGLSDVNGKLKYNGQDIGIGDMTKAEFDADGDGIIDKANDSNKLGGQLPSYYAQKTYTDTELNKKISITEKGKANGIAELDSSGKVPISQLPSYVDDVLEFSSLSAFPTTGETGKIYVATNTNLTYRWSGTGYVEISPSIALGETSSTAYRGDRGKIAYDHSQSAHARIDATKVESSTINGNIKINGTEVNVYTHPANHDDRYYTETEIDTKLAGKVDKVSGKGLSTNDYTDEEKQKNQDNADNISGLQQELVAHKAEKATQEQDGHMIKEDKIKLDGIEEGANKTDYYYGIAILPHDEEDKFNIGTNIYIPTVSSSNEYYNAWRAEIANILGVDDESTIPFRIVIETIKQRSFSMIQNVYVYAHYTDIIGSHLFTFHRVYGFGNNKWRDWQIKKHISLYSEGSPEGKIYGIYGALCLDILNNKVYIKKGSKIIGARNVGWELIGGNVDSVNGKTGEVILSASDVGAVPTSRRVNNKALTSDITIDVPDIPGLKSSRLALGGNASAGNLSVALGQNASAEAYAVALGLGASAGTNSVVLGRNTSAGTSSIALGWATSAEASAVALGSDAEAGNYSVALGMYAYADASAVALGQDASAGKAYAVALGNGALAENYNEGILGGTGSFKTSKWIVPGSFTVSGTKNFEIPHPRPDKKATHRIRHGAVESPTAGDTLYRYKVLATKDNDKVLIDLPDYFIYLNKDVQIFITPQGHFGNGYGELNRETEQLEIHCQFEGEYNVLVIGTRNDDHPTVQEWSIKGVEREIGESWTGETYAFSVDEIIEIEEIKEVVI